MIRWLPVFALCLYVSFTIAFLIASGGHLSPPPPPLPRLPSTVAEPPDDAPEPIFRTLTARPATFEPDPELEGNFRLLALGLLEQKDAKEIVGDSTNPPPVYAVPAYAYQVGYGPLAAPAVFAPGPFFAVNPVSVRVGVRRTTFGRQSVFRFR